MLLALGSDAGSAAWLNDKQIHKQPISSNFSPERISVVTLRCKAGRNTLLVKLWNNITKSRVLICPQWPARLEEQFGSQLKQDFPR